jgi:pimeloyl-ACP methyl ester carboxylesterase
MGNVSLTEFGERLFCRVAPGSGEKVLWIHGYTMDSSLWLDLWERLPAWHHIGIDLPFHGASQNVSTEYTLPSLAQTIGNLALAQGVRHIAGLSLGAIITLQVAMEFPDAFLSVTLGSAGVHGGPNDPQAGPRFWQLHSLYKQRGSGPWMTKLWMQWPPNIFKGAAAHPNLWQRLVDVIDRYTWPEFRSSSMSTLLQYRQIDHLDRIGRIRMPMFLVVGEQEMPAFKKAAAMIEETIPECECAHLPEAGHLCLLERPQASAQIINEHLQKWTVVNP